jgi:hypothetical protein
MSAEIMSQLTWHFRKEECKKGHVHHDPRLHHSFSKLLGQLSFLVAEHPPRIFGPEGDGVVTMKK